MELKGRLKLIADKVPPCDTVCDIGTDHGYIPVYLMENNICKRAIASDVKEGPLMAAKGNICMFGLEDRIDARLGDGLESIGVNEADVIIIAGMGGALISSILEQGLIKAKNAKALILQPMNAIEDLRKWLYEYGFKIFDEELTNEGEKIYTVLCVRWTGEVKKLREVYYYIGQRLIEKRDPLLKKYLQKRAAQVDEIVKGLKSTEGKAVEINTYVRLRSEFDELLKDLD